MKSFLKAFGWPGFVGLLAALLLAWLALPRGPIDRIPGNRLLTDAARVGIESALERYLEVHGVYPQPANPEETAEIEPGVICRIGGAKCLYQALTGEGNDAIQGSGENAKPSDGIWDDEDLTRVLFKDMPSTMRRKIGNHYLLVDGYGRPFQYIKADPAKKNTLNTTYDLWSYGDDETHLRATSKDTEADPSLGAKWIKNW